MPAAFPLTIVVIAGVVYHLAQRSTHGESPWLTLVVAYGGALGLTLALALVTGGAKRWHLERAEWTSGLLIGLAAFGIEAGYFFVYRAGGKLGTASVIAGASGTAVLTLIGVTFYGERLGVARAIGIALAAGGAALAARG